ncbi:hypothetical protein ACFWJT_32065 [Streptomyces sp. NPDC127069]|uniref:hypothetical protein n=1 Tax=Streptomyces sp. NPDC127069 TaxID=3347128 RepID=UPI003656538B
MPATRIVELTTDAFVTDETGTYLTIDTDPALQAVTAAASPWPWARAVGWST